MTADETERETFERLRSQGKSERTATAAAKAAAVRARTSDAGADGAGGNGAGDGHARTLAPSGALSAEERRRRVAAVLSGGPPGGGDGDVASGGHDGTAGIRERQADRVNVFPHLIGSEFLAILAVTSFIVTFAAFAPAPLQELANPNVTPNPAKAPWYFLGLQEMLRYFHPMVAGIVIPGIAGLLGLIVLPYLDKNPSVKPEHRKIAYTLWTLFLVGAATLTIVASFFRGPGFTWTWPWTDGIWFTL